MFKKSIILIVSLFLTVSLSAKINVVSSSTDLASIAEEIGKDKIKVTSIANGKNNLHYVEILPSSMLKVSKADIYLKIGMSLDYWSDNIIDGSRNSDLVIVDCSKNVERLEIPKGKLDASMGDVHPEGNPHYWLDPRNGKKIAENIFNSLVKVAPEDEQFFKTNLDAFINKLDKKWNEWQTLLSKLKGLKVISYHNTWPYLTNAFDIKVSGFVEPKPGIEPTASHTNELIKLIKNENIPILIKEPYFSNKTPNSIAENSGIKVITLPPSVGGVSEVKDYTGLFDYILNSLAVELDK